MKEIEENTKITDEKKKEMKGGNLDRAITKNGTQEQRKTKKLHWQKEHK